ncbi:MULTISPECIES: DUF4232 domain-containing protein [unclassified Streptomyces]|uniref:DUF4232 domain-containing protein n=1 Tax=unclassified Streptomyces TaxID=2593676 RepID=UPI00202DF936|nr:MULTISPECIES: DUF4232 domain-containing protein [unclassified Streptomyces]MCM1974730.1 DUF4232 domain-containing protein [Streptomyces sp. G1]MCX5123769.1 DUF4232 domain-containing protein [Streptomyces sp. NBC_00347]
MRTYRLRTTALATVTAGLALALTACGGSDSAGGPTGNPAATNSADKPASTGTATPSGEGASAAPSAGQATGNGAATVTPAKAGSGGKGAGANTGDSYAYTHPCSARNLTVKVTSPTGAPATVRVITVTNNGSTSCGLDYFPTVGFSAKGSALGLQATAPGGLGGAPAYPVRPGATAYAAVNLNPSGGNGPVADEINILADKEHMPNADGVSLQLAKPGSVANPKVGLYRTTARDALNAF